MLNSDYNPEILDKLLNSQPEARTKIASSMGIAPNEVTSENFLNTLRTGWLNPEFRAAVLNLFEFDNLKIVDLEDLWSLSREIQNEPFTFYDMILYARSLPEACDYSLLTSLIGITTEENIFKRIASRYLWKQLDICKKATVLTMLSISARKTVLLDYIRASKDFNPHSLLADTTSLIWNILRKLNITPEELQSIIRDNSFGSDKKSLYLTLAELSKSIYP